MPTPTTLTKFTRITGTDRASLQKDICKAYVGGKSIRELAAAYGRSYGFIHRLVSESDVTMRGRGGTRRKKA